VPPPADLWELPFLREALAEVTLLAVAGGTVGAWIVLRRLAFYSHAVGSATFPGLVAGDAAGVNPLLLGLAAALAYAGGVGSARRAGRTTAEATALLLVAALAIGVVLASDVFESSARVDRLLFGTLLGLSGSDIALSAACALVALAATVALGRAFAAIGFDPATAPTLGLPVAALDLGLLALIAVTAVAAIPAVGALLVGAVFLLPAATARLLAGSVPGLVWCALALALAESVAGLYLAYWLDAPPGPAIAVLGAAAYLAALAAAPLTGARARAA
jgi:ABC-type Mn2+/Zn2+ transport system permease subunit